MWFLTEMFLSLLVAASLGQSETLSLQIIIIFFIRVPLLLF